MGYLDSQDFHQHPHIRASDDTADRFRRFVSYCGPDGIIDGGILGGGAVLHPTSSRIEHTSAVSINVNMVCDQPVSTGRGVQQR